jgi:hypothetical protein
MDPLPAQAAQRASMSDEGLGSLYTTGVWLPEQKGRGIIKPSQRSDSSAKRGDADADDHMMLERERNETYRGFDRRLMDVKLKRMSK